MTDRGSNLLKALHELGGYYECPKDAQGKRFGPLVGYAGRYDDGAGNQLQQVGDVYANFAKMERRIPRLHDFLPTLVEDLRFEEALSRGPVVFCGAPEGGKAIAVLLAHLTGSDYIFPEKEVTELKTATSREESRLVWGRHEVQRGERVAIVEDVMNNFSTTKELVKLIEASGGVVVFIVGLLNRSLAVENEFMLEGHAPIPVISLVRKPIPEYHQDDPAVAADIAAGNVIWKPKLSADWAKLMLAMQAERV